MVFFLLLMTNSEKKFLVINPYYKKILFFIFFIPFCYAHENFNHDGVIYNCTMNYYVSISDKGLQKHGLQNFVFKLDKKKLSFGPGGFFHYGVYDCNLKELSCNFSDNFDFFQINHRLNKSFYFKNNYFYYTEAWYKITSIAASCVVDSKNKK